MYILNFNLLITTTSWNTQFKLDHDEVCCMLMILHAWVLSSYEFIMIMMMNDQNHDPIMMIHDHDYAWWPWSCWCMIIIMNDHACSCIIMIIHNHGTRSWCMTTMITTVYHARSWYCTPMIMMIVMMHDRGDASWPWWCMIIKYGDNILNLPCLHRHTEYQLPTATTSWDTQFALDKLVAIWRYRTIQSVTQKP